MRNVFVATSLADAITVGNNGLRTCRADVPLSGAPLV